jgi:hypothetical protein
MNPLNQGPDSPAYFGILVITNRATPACQSSGEPPESIAPVQVLRNSIVAFRPVESFPQGPTIFGGASPVEFGVAEGRV